MTTEAVMVKWLDGMEYRVTRVEALANVPEHRVCDNTLAAVLADESKRAQRALRPARNRMVSRPARTIRNYDWLRECVAAMATLSDDVSRYSV